MREHECQRLLGQSRGGQVEAMIEEAIGRECPGRCGGVCLLSGPAEPTRALSVAGLCVVTMIALTKLSPLSALLAMTLGDTG